MSGPGDNGDVRVSEGEDEAVEPLVVGGPDTTPAEAAEDAEDGAGGTVAEVPADLVPDGDTGNAAVNGDDGAGDEQDPATFSPDEHLSVEGLVADLERVTAERNQYLETSQRIQAEFENYRKQVGRREAETRERANENLVAEMLPVLDAFDGAIDSGVEDVAPMRSALLDAMAKHGLQRIDPDDAPFDPNLHEAVMHDEGDGSGPVVAEVMRAGYSWKGRVIRPAMVRVRG